MTLRIALLTGASLLTLIAAVPAMARGVPPNIHLAIKPAIMRHGVHTHFKSGTGRLQTQQFTTTATFTAAISESAVLKKKVPILAQTWYNSTTCMQPTREKWKNLTKKTQFAKISTSISTGTVTACPGTVFTFHDIDYQLLSASATQDTVTGDLNAPSFEGYNLTLIATVNVEITP
jgi:hypothetical protein